MASKNQKFQKYSSELKENVVMLRKQGVMINDLLIMFNIKSCSTITRWEKEYDKLGNDAFVDKRTIVENKNSINSDTMPSDFLFNKALLENELYAKKKDNLTMSQLRTIKFTIIRDSQVKLTTKLKCEIFNINRSSYYKWLKNNNLFSVH